ncbi:MAG: acyl-CoA dehydrogenase [Deltaproteobacteria bacterium]
MTGDKFVSLRNLRFMIHEVLNCEHLTRYPYFENHSGEVFDQILDAASNVAQHMLRPALRAMDQTPPQLVDGRVKVHPMVRTFMKECGEGGWISATAPHKLGGQQLPQIIKASFSFLFAAANYAASVYPMLTTGTAHLIESFGSEELKTTYIPRLFSGQWQGTMAMTEPQAGSSLADILTWAEPTEGNHYRLRGQKILISGGEHDGADNVVSLTLARIKGAPRGVKGISLFVVPRLRPTADASLEHNDMNVVGVFHKLGYRGIPATQLSLGENNDCRGWLLGAAHRGLAHMFQMMNEARIEAGIGAAGIASAAYYASLGYAKDRRQGRKPGTKDPALPAVPIIQHADVKRMLLFQRGVVEGSLALLLQCALYADYKNVTEGEDREKYSLLLELLTPVAKSYPSEMGIHSCSQGLQILGGYGYCDEYPVEQFYRDCRIHPIHEGTTGILGLDLLGRKIVMQEGRAYNLYAEEVRKTIRRAEARPVLAPYADKLQRVMKKLQELSDHLLKISRREGPELFLADSTLYLEFFGITAVAWQWLIMGLAAAKALKKGTSEAETAFYNGKLQTMKYFFHYEVVKAEGLFQGLLDTDGLTVGTNEADFSD